MVAALLESSARSAIGLYRFSEPGVTCEALEDVVLKAAESCERGDDCDHDQVQAAARDAAAVRDWMRLRGIASMRYAGPFGVALPPAGSEVRVKKGALVETAHPMQHRLNLGKSVVVRVHACSQGWIDWSGQDGVGRIVMPNVLWAGTGGYWRWTEVSNIEVTQR